MPVEEPTLIGPIAATVGLLVPLVVLERRMQAAGGPGIIPFELAGPDRSTEILQSWGSEGRRAARTSLLLDFPYLIAYTSLNVRLTRRASNALAAQGVDPHRHLAQAVLIIQVAAGACDAVENAALLGVVARDCDQRLASVARTAAIAKFSALVLGWLYGIRALVWRARRLRGRPRA